MTAAKGFHKQARLLLLQHLDMHPGRTVDADLDPAEVGLVGDTKHAQGGDSYHLGADQIRARNGRDRYSVDESPRDRQGLDEHASGVDVGWFKVTTPRGTFTLRDFSVWLVGLCKAGDPDTQDLREVIYSPDGKVVKRWDNEGRRTTGDSSHLSHTHLSEYRDASGVRMLWIVTRWLQHIGLIEEEGDDMATISQDDFTARFMGALKDPNVARTLRAIPWQYVGGGIPEGMSTLGVLAATHASAARAAGDDIDEAQIAVMVLAGLDPAVIAAAIPADLAGRVADELAARMQD